MRLIHKPYKYTYIYKVFGLVISHWFIAHLKWLPKAICPIERIKHIFILLSESRFDTSDRLRSTTHVVTSKPLRIIHIIITTQSPDFIKLQLVTTLNPIKKLLITVKMR